MYFGIACGYCKMTRNHKIVPLVYWPIFQKEMRWPGNRHLCFAKAGEMLCKDCYPQYMLNDLPREFHTCVQPPNLTMAIQVFPLLLKGFLCWILATKSGGLLKIQGFSDPFFLWQCLEKTLNVEGSPGLLLGTAWGETRGVSRSPLSLDKPSFHSRQQFHSSRCFF